MRRLVLALGTMLALLAPSAGFAADRTLRFGHVWPPDGGWGGAAQRFANLVSQRSGGKVEIKVFPSSQLGNEREL
jgi:TRAP-type transport system periplasmic protein